MEQLRILIKMKQTEMETGGDNKQFLKLLINIYTDVHSTTILGIYERNFPTFISSLCLYINLQCLDAKIS